MAGLPPKPGDVLPPRPTRGGTSPRAASMRDDLKSRERERDDWRRRSPDPRRFTSPRHEAWRRPGRDDDQYQDQSTRNPRDRDERESRRPRGRGNVDIYVPDSRPSDPRLGASRRRSPPVSRHKPLRSSSRTRSPPSRRYHRSESSPNSRSPSPRGHANCHRSPPRRAASPLHPRKALSRERRSPRSDRSYSPRHRQERSTSKRQDEINSPVLPAESLNKVKNSPVIKDVHYSLLEKSVTPVPKLAAHPPPLGPKRPRTPTGPRTRSPIHKLQDKAVEMTAPRDPKGKGKEIRRDGPDHKQQREQSSSPLRGSRKRTRRSRSRSLSLSHSHSPPRSLSHSRHDSPLENAGHLKKDLVDKNARRLPIDDLIIPPAPPRESKTSEHDAELKRIKEHRAKLDLEHASVTRAVRRAQHELDLALLELRSAEERRKAAERVHERTVRGFLTPMT